MASSSWTRARNFRKNSASGITPTRSSTSDRSHHQGFANVPRGFCSQLASLEEHFPPPGAARSPQPRGGHADERLLTPAPGLDPQERHCPELHLVHGRPDLLLVSC